MSELKERMLGQTMNEYGCDTKIYLKSEADKVIARNKYKRCLTMAMWCWAIKELNIFGDQDYMDFAEKWHRRWLTIAEKFKTN